MVKVSELWAEVEQVFSERNSTSLKMAILEAHKVLEAVLVSKNYPGKTVEQQLVWAGYSLKDKNGFSEALAKRKEILNKFDYLLTNIEAEDILHQYKGLITEISKKPVLTATDKIKILAELQLNPKSVLLWRNLGIFVGFFAVVRILSETEFGQGIVEFFVTTSTLIISWQFLILIGLIALAGYLITNYFKNKSQIRIKEDK